MSLQIPNLSQDEIDKMRAIVAAHDQAAGKQGIQEFDLNNPPQKPYRHQDFPRVMYHHGRREMRLAQNEEEMQAALKGGWKKEPFLAEQVEEQQAPAPAQPKARPAK